MSGTGLDPGDNAAVKKKQEETPVLMVLTFQWERQTKKSVRNRDSGYNCSASGLEHPLLNKVPHDPVSPPKTNYNTGKCAHQGL